ncbi:DUF2264 domain-containing protein [Lentzea flava]|uniref:DUF2264 domain-containing protein n=1 Tax=Lentzea flava TaxID=103732 RepID=A0ABQ2UGY3_9PSEU|nr:DUF2264 domain-containing protein [Lentzea flava]MCP2198881.1 hypothetical protein (DUF2264) [Lentzea flava]GGU33167.1 hypothetical protein GCM10010178_26890 [Lentzea flava]
MKLPDEDRALSPHTGLTRAHWVAVADGLLDSAWRFASPDQAFLDLPGRPSRSGVRSDGLEGYARTFLAAAFRTAHGDDPHNWLERYAAGLVAGTAGEWPAITDVGQPMVESASVALGLRLTRPWLWDKLSEAQQDRAEAWLREALRHVPAANNWYFFPYTVASFLEAAGRGDDETHRAKRRAMELLEGWYRGDGWYSDGDGRAFDHYNGWALHLYPALDAFLDGRPITTHLRRHLESFHLLFGSDGAPIYFGRSLTYRFAAASAVALGAVTGETPLRPGHSRHLISNALRYFLDRGSLTGGLLSLGWHGPHEATLQPYSGPASPYWAAKAFVCLLAGPDHPLWTEQEERDGSDRTLALPGPGLLIQKHNGVTRLHNHGSDHVRPFEGEYATDDDPLYSRFAYSTATGPTSKHNAPDNHISLVIGGARSVRRRIHPLGARDNWAASWHLPVFDAKQPMVPGLRIESVTAVWDDQELRIHRVIGAPAGTRAELTGWATDLPAPLVAVRGWTGVEWQVAPQGTAFTAAVSVPTLTAEVEGTVTLAAVAVLGGTVADADWNARVDEVLRLTSIDGT